MHPLPGQLLVDIAHLPEKVGREALVLGLRLLEAEDVRCFLAQQALDDADARTDGIDVPGSDLEIGHGSSLSPPRIGSQST